MVYWHNPLYDLESITISKITCKVLSGGDKFSYLYIKLNFSSFICIQVSFGKQHTWNLFLIMRCRHTYPYGDITSIKISKRSQFPPTGNTTQCTTVIITYQHTLSLIWVNIPMWTWFQPTLSYKHLLTVRDAQVFIFIGVKFFSILIIKITFCAPSIVSLALRCNTRTTWPLHPLGYDRGFIPLTYRILSVYHS